MFSICSTFTSVAMVFCFWSWKAEELLCRFSPLIVSRCLWRHSRPDAAAPPKATVRMRCSPVYHWQPVASAFSWQRRFTRRSWTWNIGTLSQSIWLYRISTKVGSMRRKSCDAHLRTAFSYRWWNFLCEVICDLLTLIKKWGQRPKHCFGERMCVNQSTKLFSLISMTVTSWLFGLASLRVVMKLNWRS